MKRILGVVLTVALLVPVLACADQAQDKKAILDAFNALAEKNPGILAGAVFTLGDAYAKESKPEEAIAIFEKAQSLLSDNEDFLNRLANLYNMKMLNDKAANVYEKLVGLRPDNIMYTQMLSNALNSAGKKEEAAAIWKKLVTDKPKDANILSQAANFYSNNNDMEQAIGIMEKVVGLDANNMGYTQSLATMYTRAEKTDKAEALLKKILETAKDSWLKDWANGEILNIYQKHNKLDDLAKAYEADIKNNPNSTAPLKKLAELYTRKNEPLKAIEIFEKAVKISDERDLNNRLLDLYDMHNKPQEAAAIIEKLIKANPNEIFLQERLAGIYEKAGKKDEAKKAWQALVAQSNDPMISSRYAEALYRLGDVSAALAEFKKAEETDTMSGGVNFALRRGQILLDTGKKDEAKAIFEKIAATAKDDWWKNEAKRKVAEIENIVKTPKIEPAAVAQNATAAVAQPIAEAKQAAVEAKETARK